uniref:Uncharacterized protein n=1 Tax=Leptobrachium leishanense TaxID=445787 RepID=A0A8C5PND8_9ANUR
MASADLLDELTCAICTDIYRDPAVTVNCGHSFCHECITSTWDNQEKRKYFCPECLGRFRVRPLIKRDLKVGIPCTYCFRFMAPSAEHAEKSVQSLEELRRQVQEKAAGVTERVTALITNIREQAETPEKEALSEISRQEEQVSLRVSDLIRQLEIKKEELSRKMGDIEELCNMTDLVTVLQGQESGRDDYCDAERYDIKVHDLGELIKVTLYSGLAGIVTAVTRWRRVPEASNLLLDVIKASDVSLDVNTASDVSMDVNTASNYVSVSDDLKTVSWSEMTQSRPETPERFQDFHQVLSSSRFSSGRHYWEVEVSESGWWVVGMVYPTIERRGDQSAIGINSVSWGLGRGWFNNQYSVIHDSKLIQLPHSSSGQRLGILLDYEVGRLSFYELCDPIRHVHTFTAVFTEPLHAVFGVYRYNSSVRISGILCPLK